MQKKKNILQNLWKNQEYILYYAKIILKTRVAGSYLGFLWLWIDPLMFMLIYSFVVMFIFKSKIEHFNVFVLIGITAWNFFSRAMLMATTSIVRNKSIFQQVYFHKFVYPTLYLVSYIYEFFISLSLILIVMLFEGIPITWHVIEVIPILITMALFTYGCSLIISHIGVYLFDLRNILDFTLKFIFYLTPIMWSFENVSFSFAWILKLNPMQIIIGSFRSCLLYGKSPIYFYLLVISCFSCILIEVGYELISRKEDEYARMI
ncbi:MAG: ABC transporter permease [Lachnospiraceae bacterium]|nr:ABC transporter permease [Lachnospiraceae bacterium]